MWDDRVRGILALSHVWVLPALVKAGRRGSVGDAALVLAIGMASVWMHLRETKHGLKPQPDWHPRAPAWALNADRAVATLAACYFLARRWPLSAAADGPLVLAAVVAAAFCAAGERTASLPAYTACHLVWHAAMFVILYIVV